jgi:hypothetical protein
VTVFDKMKIEFLQGLKAAGEEVQHFRVPELASEYGIKEGYVRERLVEWHNDKLIRLSASMRAVPSSLLRSGPIPNTSSTTLQTAITSACAYWLAGRNF